MKLFCKHHYKILQTNRITVTYKGQHHRYDSEFLLLCDKCQKYAAKRFESINIFQNHVAEDIAQAHGWEWQRPL